MTSPLDEKAQWEIKKLKAEVQQLSRSWLRTPASWVVIATTLAALAGAWFQWYKSDIDFQLAEIKRERTAFETEKLERLRAQHSAEVQRAKVQLNQLLEKTAAVSANLELAEKKLKALGNQLSATPASQAAVRQATESLRSLRAANAALSAQTEKTSDALGGFLKDLRPPQPPSLSLFSTDLDLLRFCREKVGPSFFPLDTEILYCTDGKATVRVQRADVCRWAYGTDDFAMDWGNFSWSCDRD